MSVRIMFGATLLAICAFAGDVEKGKAVYAANCANCHSVNMSGGMGKDFNLVSYTRTKDEIKQYAMSPSSNFRKFGYSANAMPTLNLNISDAEDIAEYVNSLQKFKIWMKSK